jgi:hypothetical protein
MSRRRHTKGRRVLVLLTTALSISCGDNLAPDLVLEVFSPERGTTIDAYEVVVSGRATSGSWGLSGVEINGRRAQLDGSGRFSLAVVLEPGTNLIETVAFGPGGAAVTDRRAVSAGGFVESAVIGSGIVMRMGSRGLYSQAAAIRSNLDMDAIYSEIRAEPLKVAGTICPRDVVSASAVLTPVEELFLFGSFDGLRGEALITNLDVSYEAEYTDVSCVTQPGTFTFETLELHWTYGVDIKLDGPADRPVNVSLINSETLFDHELIYTNEDIDPAAFDRMTDMHELLAARLVDLLSTEISLRTSEALNQLGQETTFSVAGEEFDITVRPEAVSFDDGEGLVLLFSNHVRSRSSSAPAFVPTPMPPRLPEGFDAALTIADDALDQALGAAWRAGVFDLRLPSGSEMELLLPPVVRILEDGSAAVLIGDWIAQHEEGRTSLHGIMVLGPDTSEGKLRLTPLSAELLSYPIEGVLDENLQAVLRDDAGAVLRNRVAEILAGVGLPIADHAAEALAVTGRDGYIEIALDRESL